jgi:CHAD domain-containing protein
MDVAPHRISVPGAVLPALLVTLFRVEFMPVDLKRQRFVFHKLDRQLNRLEKKLAAHDLHQFRTSSRRVEVLISDLASTRSRNARKVARALGRMRKKAGAARDLDVQIGLLRNLRVPQDATRKSQLLESLLDERVRRERKVRGIFEQKTVRDLRRKLKRALRQTEQHDHTEPWNLALSKIAELSRAHTAVTEQSLHQFRIAGKRIRYLLEFTDRQDGAEILVGPLKRMQDVIGDWHDWLKLTRIAERRFADATGSVLLAVLRNVTRAKFRQACSILAETRTSLSRKPVESLPRRKSSAPAPKPVSKAAA